MWAELRRILSQETVDWKPLPSLDPKMQIELVIIRN